MFRRPIKILGLYQGVKFSSYFSQRGILTLKYYSGFEPMCDSWGNAAGTIYSPFELSWTGIAKGPMPLESIFGKESGCDGQW